MVGGLERIQHVQDAVASQCNLTLVLIDPDGNSVTHPSQASDIARMVREEIACFNEWIPKMVEVNVLDTYLGFKVILSPVRAMGKVAYYVWAGVLIDKELRPSLHEFLESNMEDAEKWKSVLDEAQETTAAERKRIIEKIKVLSDVVGALLECDQKERMNKQVLESIHKASESVGNEYAFSSMIQQFMNIQPDLEFVGFAERTDGECTVVQVFGEPAYHSLIGSSFHVGEGFLGHVMSTGVPNCWNKIRNDLRGSIFRREHIQLRALVCFPVMENSEVIGVLFGGSCLTDRIGSLTFDLGKIFANMIRVCLTQHDLHNNAIQQIQRLNAVIEIFQLIPRMQDVHKIAMMLVDMSLNITQWSFAAMTLFDLDANPDEMRILSRGLTTEQSEAYGRLLLCEYREKWLKGKGGLESGRPELRQLEWGPGVVEMPMVNQKFYGVLSVSVNPNDDHSTSFLATLATIGAMAIRQSSQSRNEAEQGVVYLHEAIRQWDPAAYEFARDLRKMAVSFLEFLEAPPSDKTEIGHACLLSPYHPDTLSGILGQNAGICRIIQDYSNLDYCAAKETALDGQSYTLGGQVLKLASDYMRNAGKIYAGSHYGVDPALGKKFNSFVARNQVLDQRVSIKDQIHFEIEGLSGREQEVLNWIVQGLNNKQIATKLFISEHTVKNHITKIFKKLEINDRAGVMAYFYQQKMKNG